MMIQTLLSATQPVAQNDPRIAAMGGRIATTCPQVVTGPGTSKGARPVPGPAPEPLFFEPPAKKFPRIGSFATEAQVFIVLEYDMRDCTVSLNPMSGRDLERGAVRVALTKAFDAVADLFVTGGPEARTGHTAPFPVPIARADSCDEYLAEGLIPVGESQGVASCGNWVSPARSATHDPAGRSTMIRRATVPYLASVEDSRRAVLPVDDWSRPACFPLTQAARPCPPNGPSR